MNDSGDPNFRRRSLSWLGPLLGIVIVLSGPVVHADDKIVVASWDMRESRELAAELQPRQSQSTWRTTFGAERRSTAAPEASANASAPGVDADVLLIQGIPLARTAGRLFPARRWHLSVSRELFLRGPSIGAHAVTAVAIRVKPGVRVTAVEHLLDIVPAAAGQPSNAAKPPKLGDAATTAVKVSINGKSVWFASAAIVDDCRKHEASCAARERLEAWTQAKLAEGDTVVVGGHLPARTAAPAQTEASPDACATQQLEVHRDSTVASDAKQMQDERRGCFRYVELPL